MSYFATEPVPYTPIKYTLWLVPEHEDAKKAYNYTSTTYPYNENAGFDLVSMNSSFDPTVGHRKAFMANFGVRAMMTRGDTLTLEDTVHYRLVPRSSIYKTGYMMANSEGIIDRTYTGVLKAPLVFVNNQSEHAGMWEGNKYFQIVAPDLGWIHKVCVVDSLPSTERGDGGFGSTDVSGRYIPYRSLSTYPGDYTSPDLSGVYRLNAPSSMRGNKGRTYTYSGATGCTGTLYSPSGCTGTTYSPSGCTGPVSTIYSTSSQPSLSTFSTLSSPSTMCSTNSISYIYSFSNPPSTVAVVSSSGTGCMPCT